MRKTDYIPYNMGNKVLVVGVINYELNSIGEYELFDWAAYIDCVPGENHQEEYELVAKHGNKVPKQLAVIMFPLFSPNKYRR